MKLNSDLIIKNSLSGNEENYAPSVKAVKTKTDSIDSNISIINGNITTINTALNKRMTCVKEGSLFGTIAKNSTVTRNLDQLGMHYNSSVYLIAFVGSNAAWRDVAIISTHNGQINSVNTIMESMLTLSTSSGNLTCKNTNNEWSVTPNVRVYLLAHV